MRKALALLLVLIALDAHAQAVSLQGQWEIRASRGYLGIVLVDAEGRATWDSPNDGGRGARVFGYVASRQGENVEFLVTDRRAVTRARCVLQSDDVMNCYSLLHSGPSEPYMLVRVGPGPASLMPASR